jgi:hypothetical protein
MLPFLAQKPYCCSDKLSTHSKNLFIHRFLPGAVMFWVGVTGFKVNGLILKPGTPRHKVRLFMFKPNWCR